MIALYPANDGDNIESMRKMLDAAGQSFGQYAISSQLILYALIEDSKCIFREPKKVIQALTDSSWMEAMQEELLQFQLQKVWTLVDLPNGKRAIRTKWVFRNKKDERGIVIETGKDWLHQGVTITSKRRSIDYDVVFDPCGCEVVLRYVMYGLLFEEETTSTPMEPNKALAKDEEADSMDVHLYRSMIGSLIYLTASRPDIMFPVLCLYKVPRGCQFLGKRLISWQCKKQTIVANSHTDAESLARGLRALMASGTGVMDPKSNA
ncbi:hypothetical protein Tco_1262862 [Tanacetum coccineum]